MPATSLIAAVGSYSLNKWNALVSLIPSTRNGLRASSNHEVRDWYSVEERTELGSAVNSMIRQKKNRAILRKLERR